MPASREDRLSDQERMVVWTGEEPMEMREKWTHWKGIYELKPVGLNNGFQRRKY